MSALHVQAEREEVRNMIITSRRKIRKMIDAEVNRKLDRLMTDNAEIKRANKEMVSALINMQASMRAIETVYGIKEKEIECMTIRKGNAE